MKLTIAPDSKVISVIRQMNKLMREWIIYKRRGWYRNPKCSEMKAGAHRPYPVFGWWPPAPPRWACSPGSAWPCPVPAWRWSRSHPGQTPWRPHESLRWQVNEESDLAYQHGSNDKSNQLAEARLPITAKSDCTKIKTVVLAYHEFWSRLC